MASATCGARRRREIERTGFLINGSIKAHVGTRGQRRLQIADNGDDRRLPVFEKRQHRKYLVRLAAVTDDDDDIRGRDDTESAVQRV
jgi:hypothetical protein